MNPVLRWLDDPPKLFGFSLGQWAWLVLGTASLAALLHVLSVPLRPALTVLIFLVGVPAAITYLSEFSGTGLSALLRDALRWRAHTHHYDSSGAPRPAGLVVCSSDRPASRRRRRRHSTRTGGAS